jgi:hypothetical protein
MGGTRIMAYIKPPEIPEIMTVEFIKKALEHINLISGDDERAHIAEDSLYHAVVYSIANQECSDPVLCCKELLNVEEINFERWHA